MLRTAFKIGLIGCVFSFVMIIVSNAIYYWQLSIIFSGAPHDYNLPLIISIITNPLSSIASILTTIGFYALLRSNRSKLALPYVFLSLITQAIPWNFLLSLGIDYSSVYQVLYSTTSVSFTLILVWILWTINDTVCDRELLRNIVLLTLLNMFYSSLIVNVLGYFIPLFNLVDIILHRFPSILLILMRVLLLARLFKRYQAVVIVGEIGQTATSEWL